jgi:hypothetical protein
MSAFGRNKTTMLRGAISVLRRLAVLVALGLAVAVPAAAAQTDPARLAVTATSDHCARGGAGGRLHRDQPDLHAGVGPDLVAG